MYITFTYSLYNQRRCYANMTRALILLRLWRYTNRTYLLTYLHVKKTPVRSPLKAVSKLIAFLLSTCHVSNLATTPAPLTSDCLSLCAIYRFCNTE